MSSNDTGKQTKFDGHVSTMRDGSPWLASEDILERGDVVVEIEQVFFHEKATFEAGRKEDVYSLKFKDRTKLLVLNVTNRKTLVKLFGAKTAEWRGRLVSLYVDPKVHLMGELVNGIRIRPTEPKAKPGKTTTQQ